MLCHTTDDILCYVTHDFYMLCYITDDMLYNTLHFMLYNT